MGFWGKLFIFDGIPSDAYDLMLYDVGGESQGDNSFASTVDVIEETVGTKWRPYFYGVKYNKKLEFEIVFGVNDRRIDAGKYLDRYEIDQIAAWLTGHDGYRWFEIVQEDMVNVRYRCIVTELAVTTYGQIPYVFRLKVICDSPFAYKPPQRFTYVVNGTKNVQLLNDSGFNGDYKPVLTISNLSGDTFSIVNHSDNDRELKFEGVPGSVTRIVVDNDNMVITNNQDLDLYECFNFSFLRLKRGWNMLSITGNAEVAIDCEFPVNVGA